MPMPRKKEPSCRNTLPPLPNPVPLDAVVLTVNQQPSGLPHLYNTLNSSGGEAVQRSACAPLLL